MTTRADRRNLLRVLLSTSVVAIGLPAGCDVGGPSLDDATVIVQEPGGAILGETPTSESASGSTTPGEAPPETP
jgi:hypothetical protein